MTGAPSILLVVGIHREELAFGRAVAAGLAPGAVDLLVVGEGLSGRHPRADQRFHWDTLHRALYLQLPPHVRPRHRLLVDLHAGLDSRAPSADLYCRDTARLGALLDATAPPVPAPRLVPLRESHGGLCAETVIPPEIWRDLPCLYVGMEIYLAQPGAGSPEEQGYGRALVAALADGLALERAPAPGQRPRSP